MTAVRDLRFISEMDACVAAGDREGWEFNRGVYADWLEEEGRVGEAERIRWYTGFPLSRSSEWPDANSLPDLSDHQRSQYSRATGRPIGILCGTPGTGKSWTLGALIMELVRKYGVGEVAVCAPTGKAAVRVNQLIARHAQHRGWHGALPQARTIHSLLQIGRNGHDGEGWGFIHNRTNKLDYKYICVDEASMADVETLNSLLQAVKKGGHVLLVGDIGQLPPVGHGAPLRDLIRAGVPLGELSEIRRNAGQVVRACAAIRRGDRFEVTSFPARPDEDAGANFWHIEEREPERVLSLLSEVVGRIIVSPKKRYHPFNDVQVLCSLNEKSILGRYNLNRVLQQILNGDMSPVHPGSDYRPRDKIICLQNGWYMLDGTGDPDAPRIGNRDAAYIANGEQGTVIEGEENGALLAQFGSRLHHLTKNDVKEFFDLAYAQTCHKAQGSSWPIVIIPIDRSPGSWSVCGREWWYTAWSRCEIMVITIGRMEVMERQAYSSVLEIRKTFLTERIIEGLKI